MERKFLEDMGLDKDQVNSIMRQYGQDISGYKNMQSEIDTLIIDKNQSKMIMIN